MYYLLLLYSSINPEGEMETAHLSAFIDSMLKTFNRNSPKINTSSRIASLEATHNNTKSEFSQSVEKKVQIVRAKFIEAMEHTKKVEDNECLTSIEANMLRIITSKLTILNREYTHWLEEGILTLYMDICSLLKTCSKSKIRISIKNLLKQISEGVKILLIDHFIYQEYLHRRQNENSSLQETSKQFDQFSNQKKAEKIISEDAQILKQIQRQIKNIPIHQLLKQQMQMQEKKIKSTVEVCRICFHKVLLLNIQSHVKTCQKQNTLKQNIQQKNYQFAHLKSQLRRRSEDMVANSDNQEFSEDFRLIARIILTSERKEKNVDRRCSLIGVRSEKQIGDNIIKLIQQFFEVHGEQPLLKRIITTYREKVYLEKKLHHLQLSRNRHDQSYNKQNQGVNKKQLSTDDYLKNERMPNTVKLHKKLSKKGKECFDDGIEGKVSSISAGKSQSSIEQDLKKNSPSIKLLHSKKILSKKVIKTDQLEDPHHYRRYSSLQSLVQHTEKEQISLNNFQILRVLGEGAFGKVYMVRRKQTKDIYALKIIKIPQNNIQTSLQLIKRQHQIFKKIAGEHLVKAPFSFSQKACHIFILEYLPGGDLRRLLNEEVYLQQDRAKAYLAEIILAIEHLHNFSIIHRDLKPQNLVFDRLGHLKLTDFGLSEFQMSEKLQKSRKQSMDRDLCRKTRRRREAVLSNNKQKMKLIGTPDYIAPEIIFKTSLNNYSIDWWSLGVMAYELLIGTRPFCAESIEEVIDNITNFNIEWPEVGYQEGMISPQAKDLICQLLNKDFMHRLGSNGADQLKTHPFFSTINWKTIKSQKPLALPKMTNFRQCIQIEEDLSLRKEISLFLERGQKKRTVDLQKFIRFDLLGTETIENVHKINQQHSKKLSTLKQLQQTLFTDENLEGQQDQ